jgi:hypothetical protein
MTITAAESAGRLGIDGVLQDGLGALAGVFA